MRRPRPLISPLLLLAALCAATPAAADESEAALAAVREIGLVNGLALACKATDAAAHARLLMLAHAPKTARFGAAYDEATQEGFRIPTQAADACPDARALGTRLDAAADRLRAALPAAR